METQRFWSHVDRQPLRCWLWTASLKDNGYGQVMVDGHNRYPHRVAWELLVGPIPAGTELDHLCRVRHCVNPRHLQPVTHTVNVRRGRSAGLNLEKWLAPWLD